MPEIAVKIKNLPQIKAAFKLAPSLMTAELNKAIRYSIFTIDRESKIRTPVDTGRLRASHTQDFGTLRGSVGPTAHYSNFVHEGTRFMKGRPFLLNAVKAGENKIQRFFTDAVQAVLNKIGRNIG